MTSDVEEFAENVAAQSRCIDAGDSVQGNKHARRYINAFERLRKQGDAGRDALAALLDDPRADVRVTAAAYLLRHCGPRAKAVLEAAAGKPGLASFTAEQVLKHWANGTWTLDVL
jgi:hypothetical protein